MARGPCMAWADDTSGRREDLDEVWSFVNQDEEVFGEAESGGLPGCLRERGMDGTDGGHQVDEREGRRLLDWLPASFVWPLGLVGRCGRCDRPMGVRNAGGGEGGPGEVDCRHGCSMARRPGAGVF